MSGSAFAAGAVSALVSVLLLAIAFLVLRARLRARRCSADHARATDEILAEGLLDQLTWTALDDAQLRRWQRESTA